MKAIVKNLLMASLLLTTTATSAQRTVQNIEDWMDANISRVLDAKIDVQKSLGQERDVQQAGAPLKWRYDTYTFTLPKKRRSLLDAMIQALEANGHDNPNCYSINSLTETPDGDIYGSQRNLMIGEDVNRYVTIGKDYNNYLNVNILDAADTTKSHRYAYALEWREAQKGAVDVRYIVTYAKIPPATTSIISQDWPFLDLGKSKVKRDKILIKGNARVQWGGKDYPIDSLNALICDAERRREEMSETIRKHFQDKEQGSDNILLIFSQLKKQFNEGDNMELNAISIYSLCKRARETGYFTHDADAKEFLKGEIQAMVDDLIRLNGFKTERGYLELAVKELEKIK